jgi:hypothetical protein
LDAHYTIVNLFSNYSWYPICTSRHDGTIIDFLLYRLWTIGVDLGGRSRMYEYGIGCYDLLYGQHPQVFGHRRWFDIGGHMLRWYMGIRKFGHDVFSGLCHFMFWRLVLLHATAIFLSKFIMKTEIGDSRELRDVTNFSY